MLPISEKQVSSDDPTFTWVPGRAEGTGEVLRIEWKKLRASMRNRFESL